MSNKRKFLEGELKYVEGKATASTLLKSIASELVEQGWVDYPRNESAEYWGFNGLRQIVLHTETTMENIRLYRAVINTMPNGDEVFTKGEIINQDSYKITGRIIEGLDGTNSEETKQGRFVFIERIHSDIMFQQTTFLKNSGMNGVENISAKIKSIPKGRITLYKDTPLKVTEEVLLNKNDNGIIFNMSRTPVSMSKDEEDKLKVFQDGILVEEDLYTVDYFNGNIIFREHIEGEVTAIYNSVTGVRGAVISQDDYSVMGEEIFTSNPLLVNEDIIVDVGYYWDLHYPETVDQVSNRAIFKTKVDVSPDNSRNAFKTFYWELGKFDVDLPTTTLREKLMTYDKKDFFTTYSNINLEANEDGVKPYTLYIDGEPQEDGVGYSINREGKVSFPIEQGGEVLLEDGELSSVDFQTYKLGNNNIIEGTLRIVANKGKDNEYEMALSRANINYSTGDIEFLKPVTGGGTSQTALKTSDFVFTLTTNDSLYRVNNVYVGGEFVSPSTYTVDLAAKTVTLNNPSAYGYISPENIVCDFETETTLHAEYQWSNLVELEYEYYPQEDSPLFDDMIEGNNELSDYVTGFRSRFSSKLESPTPSADYGSAHYRLDPHHVSPWSKWSWYRKKAAYDGDVKLGTWTPVKFFMNFTQEYVNIVLQGEQSVDSHPYKNYIISYAYVGALENYECSVDDDINNFAMTVGSDELYNKKFYDTNEIEKLPEMWGYKTGTGVTDITMEKTHSNLPFQAHYPSFYTNPEFMDKHFISVSESTKRHHFSPITVTHGTERERGKMQSVVIGDRSAIFHLDELIEKRDEFNTEDALVDCDGGFLNKCQEPIESEERKYVQFNINAPYWFANNSPNTLYGLAIRKS